MTSVLSPNTSPAAPAPAEAPSERRELFTQMLTMSTGQIDVLPHKLPYARRMFLDGLGTAPPPERRVAAALREAFGCR